MTKSAYWAILPEVAMPCLEKLNSQPLAQADPIYKLYGNIAILRIEGIIGYDISPAQIRSVLKSAMADVNTAAIMLVFDSPGGIVSGVKELADYIGECAQIKPMAAYADGVCCSAAYWLAAATGRIYSPATAQVGSIGVMLALYEWTKANEKMGVAAAILRLGAIKGVVMDPDGRVLHDIYDTFGVSKTTQAFSVPATSPKNGNPVLNSILAAKRKSENAMLGNPYERLEAICGSDFYDALTGNELVRDVYNLWAANLAAFGENDYRKRGFTYGGVTFYEASEVVGGKTLVEAKKAHLYPVGTGIWKVYNAPADWNETVNTIGLPYYARMSERPHSRGYEIEVQANPLTLCLFPQALVELTLES